MVLQEKKVSVDSSQQLGGGGSDHMVAPVLTL